MHGLQNRICLSHSPPTVNRVFARTSPVIPSSVARSNPRNRSPVDEILTFPFPARTHKKQFDEITVVIKPAKERSLVGACITI
jgi:hypothetical protein